MVNKRIIYIIIIIIFNNYLSHIYNIKLNFYYKTRTNFLLSLNKTYNESNLVTFEDKLNWLAIHDINKLKGKCSDKILLHYYSKKNRKRYM